MGMFWQVAKEVSIPVEVTESASPCTGLNQAT